MSVTPFTPRFPQPLVLVMFHQTLLLEEVFVVVDSFENTSQQMFLRLVGCGSCGCHQDKFVLYPTASNKRRSSLLSVCYHTWSTLKSLFFLNFLLHKECIYDLKHRENVYNISHRLLSYFRISQSLSCLNTL